MSDPHRIEFKIPDGIRVIPDPVYETCPDCNKERRQGRPCESCKYIAEAPARLRNERRAAGFPPRFDWVDPDNFQPPPGNTIRLPLGTERKSIAQVLGAIDATQQPVVTFCGPAGSGKTSLAVAAARMRSRPTYASAIDLERDVTTGQLGQEARTLERARTCHVLVLDDLGKEPGTKLNPIPAIIQHRHDHELYTLVTTGLSPEQVLARYDEGIHRRLFEGTAAMVLRWK